MRHYARPLMTTSPCVAYRLLQSWFQAQAQVAQEGLLRLEDLPPKPPQGIHRDTSSLSLLRIIRHVARSATSFSTKDSPYIITVSVLLCWLKARDWIQVNYTAKEEESIAVCTYTGATSKGSLKAEYTIYCVRIGRMKHGKDLRGDHINLDHIVDKIPPPLHVKRKQRISVTIDPRVRERGKKRRELCRYLICNNLVREVLTTLKEHEVHKRPHGNFSSNSWTRSK